MLMTIMTNSNDNNHNQFQKFNILMAILINSNSLIRRILIFQKKSITGKKKGKMKRAQGVQKVIQGGTPMCSIRSMLKLLMLMMHKIICLIFMIPEEYKKTKSPNLALYVKKPLIKYHESEKIVLIVVKLYVIYVLKHLENCHN